MKQDIIEKAVRVVIDAYWNQKRKEDGRISFIR